MRKTVILALAAAVLLAAPKAASAFCGFYVGGADAKLFNDATQVVMMRHGTTTVLSMQNAYKGPPSDFAMVVPVPVVLQEENVKTLPAAVFDKIDRLSAPRLVEYWEEDPCAPEVEYDQMKPMLSNMPVNEMDSGGAPDMGVKIEAQFDVAEYNIVILSASESTGLNKWLHKEGYKIPEGAEPYLRPYVEAGSKFFVAKVDAKKVQFKDRQAMLSPLRFNYESKDFALPVRLGMMNSAGTQDLIVNILAPGQRYELANYPNVTIPTNINLKDKAKGRFGEFYAALFDSTLERSKGAVVTEYAWDASACDPCPGPTLDYQDILTLGGDVTGSGGGMVLTRLHARYSSADLADDLVFKAAPPIAGGREVRNKGKLEEGSVPGHMNNFQGRYAIRHEWEGPIECKEPRRSRWGGPPAGKSSGTQAAQDLAFAPRGALQLTSVLASPVPELGLSPGASATPEKKYEVPSAANEDAGKKKSSKGCSTSGGSGLGFGLLILGLAFVLRRRRA
ncbi:MAG: DUF2330 domain-containing protein [Myxococcales bacterium]|nr:DUF2330 domain-containing protein [Myxococcales bacterium]